MQEQSTTERTFAVATLGCKVNQADSEHISDQMSAAGFSPREFTEPADVYIVNTCTVTHLGDRSSRQMISQARRRHPEALLVVTGCYAELNPEGVAALPGVDLVIGNQAKDSLAEAIQQHQATQKAEAAPTEVLEELAQHLVPANDFSDEKARRILPLLSASNQHLGSNLMLDSQHIGSDLEIGSDAEPQPENPARLSPFEQPQTFSGPRVVPSRTRVQMKVQDGCNNRCTYCIVPYVRGNSRSRSIASVVDNVKRKVDAGYQEVVLTGIHLGDYHPDAEQSLDLGDLIASLLKETSIPRIRVSSLEPEDFQLEWLRLWQDPRMCRHLHLPMQSGSDLILRKMARHYNSARYATIITTAKQLVPGMAISTDIITGFPGETDEDFEQTYQLARRLEFAKSHVFRFSPRQGTAAARMRGQVKEDVKKARTERLLELNNEHARIFRQQFVGQQVSVLMEARRKSGWEWEGLTDNYLRVEVEGLPEDSGHNWQHTVLQVQLTRLVEDGIRGQVML